MVPKIGASPFRKYDKYYSFRCPGITHRSPVGAAGVPGDEMKGKVCGIFHFDKNGGHMFLK
jgi:hypothetical protein